MIAVTGKLRIYFFWSCVINLNGASVYAQNPISTPDSGDLLQQQRAPLEIPKLKKNSIYELRSQTEGNDSPPFYVKHIELSGNHVVSGEALQLLLQPYQERELTLNDLQVLCYDIGDYYRQQGYLFSRAVVPQQAVKGGVVQLQIIEAKLNQVSVNNSSGVKSTFLQRIAKPAQDHQSISESRLNRVLLLMQDLPGVEVKTSIQAGNSLGQSDLVVNVSERRPEHRVSVDNYGSRATHRLRGSGQFQFANLAGYGDLLSVNVSSSGERMVQTGLNYQLGLGGYGSQIGFSLSYLDYALGENLKDLNAEGQAKSGGVYWRQQWRRGLSYNLDTQLNLQRQALDDKISSGNFQTKRDVDSLSLSVNSDWSGWLGENSVGRAQLSAHAGWVEFDNADAEQRDALSADTEGRFSYLKLDLQHRQAINPNWQYSLRLGLQKSFDNLDSSQKSSTAGPYAVRAYNVGVLSGDSSLVVSGELSYGLPETDIGDFSLYGFVDAAKTRINQRLWQGVSGRNNISLVGAGIGLRWSGLEKWSVNTYVAAPLGSRPSELGKTNGGLLWFELSRRI